MTEKERLILRRVLLIIQGTLFVLCVYAIIDAYMMPYTSEWLTADVFVPFYLLAMFVLLCGMWSTSLLTRRAQRRG